MDLSEQLMVWFARNLNSESLQTLMMMMQPDTAVLLLEICPAIAVIVLHLFHNEEEMAKIEQQYKQLTKSTNDRNL